MADEQPKYASIINGYVVKDAKARTDIGTLKGDVSILDGQVDKASEGVEYLKAYTLTAEDKIKALEESNEGLKAEIEALEQRLEDLLYTAIHITKFTHNAGTREYGDKVTSVTLSWSINTKPTKLTLNGEEIGVTERSRTLTGLSIDMNNTNKHTWELIATDSKGTTSRKTTAKISFANGIYYGAKKSTTQYNASFISSLKKELCSSIKSSFSVTAGAGEYIYYCIPTRLVGKGKKCIFKVGIFWGGINRVATLQYTNAYGYTEEYQIYVSDNSNLGECEVSVQTEAEQ